METVEEIREAAESVHDSLGVGFTESVYHRALMVELSDSGVEHSSETTIPITYGGHSVGRRRPDLMVRTEDGLAVVELKAGTSSGEKQLLQYLDLLADDDNFDVSRGILIQFNEELAIHHR